jgi:hypothetical protein
MSDMTNNRVPYGLLTDEEKAALHEHEKHAGAFKVFLGEDACWAGVLNPTWNRERVYRTVPLPKTQDVIAWDRLPKEAEWTARDAWGAVRFYEQGDTVEINVVAGEWDSYISGRRIDDFPGIVVQIGTVDWQDSKQRRPK